MAIQNVKGNAGVIPAATSAPAGETGKAEKSARVATAAASYAKTNNSPSVKDAANVQISPRAKEMSLAKKVASEAPDVNEEKIAKFKDKIARGEYKPDPQKIADGIAREALMDDLAHAKN